MLATVDYLLLPFVLIIAGKLSDSEAQSARNEQGSR
jgi:hypothetical protein